jgi:hypothetical protein
MSNEQKTDNIVLFVLALCGVSLHILLNEQYGFHHDELDFILSARQFSWGYIFDPPISPPLRADRA